MDTTYWYLFPLAIVIASVANGAGVGGATFFAPLFVLALRLPPQVAIGTALITEVFGFASGVLGHARAGTIDWTTSRLLAATAVPAAVGGSLLAGVVEPEVLKVVLGVGLLGVALAFVRHHSPEEEDAAIGRGEGVVEPARDRLVVARDGRRYRYRVCRAREGSLFAGLGGLFVGLISTGLGEANSFALVKRCRVPSRIAVGTSVAAVAVTALAAGATHFAEFARAGGDTMRSVVSLVTFTVPGVVIGGQLGPRLLGRLPEQTLIRTLGWLFLGVALLTLAEVVL